MKKLFSVLVLGLACAGLAACGKQAPAEDKEAKILDNHAYEQICAFGTNQVTVDGEDVDNDWGVKEYNVMHAISLKELKELSPAMRAALNDRNVVGLYRFDGLVLGAKDAGWENPAKNAEGEKVNVNGSYMFKACGVDKNEDDEWVKTCHFPSAEAHGECLTPEAAFITPNMSSEADADGFDHNSNPAAYQAGQYTLILALYKTGVGEMNITNGLGLVKTADRDPYIPPQTYPITSATLGGVNGDWDNGYAMTLNDGVFTATFTAEAAGSFKVKLNGAWNYSLGSGALDDKQYHDNDGNIAYAAGTTTVTVKLSAESMADFNTAKVIEVFTVVAA